MIYLLALRIGLTTHTRLLNLCLMIKRYIVSLTVYAWSPDGRFIATYKGVDAKEFTVKPCLGAMFILSMSADIPVNLDNPPSQRLSPVNIKSGYSFEQLCSARGEIAWVSSS